MATVITIHEVKKFLGFNIPVSGKVLPRAPAAKEKRDGKSLELSLRPWGYGGRTRRESLPDVPPPVPGSG